MCIIFNPKARGTVKGTSIILNFGGMLTLRTSTSNKSDEFGGTLEGTPCYTNTQQVQFSEEQMNQLLLILIAICKGGKGGQPGDHYKRS